MSMRWMLLPAVLALAVAGRAGAAYQIGVSNLGQSTSTSPGGQTGTLTFGLATKSTGPGGVNAGTSPTPYDLSTYTDVQPSQPVAGGSFVNGSINYDLIVTVGQTTAGDLGTIEIGGSGQGGFDSNQGSDNRPFINDTLDAVKYNGQSLGSLFFFPGFPDSFNNNDFARFSLATGGGDFLNFRLYDPNPDSDRFSPTPGLTFDISLTRQPLDGYQVLVAAPAQVTAVPEPGAMLLLALGACCAGTPALRSLRGRRAAVPSAA